MKKKTTDENKQFYIFSDTFFLFFEQGTHIFIFTGPYMLHTQPYQETSFGRLYFLPTSSDISTAKVDSVFTSLHHTSLPSTTLLTLHQGQPCLQNFKHCSKYDGEFLK